MSKTGILVIVVIGEKPENRNYSRPAARLFSRTPDIASESDGIN